MSGFMKYDGIDGETSDSNHDKWIDVLSIDWGSHKPASAPLVLFRNPQD